MRAVLELLHDRGCKREAPGDMQQVCRRTGGRMKEGRGRVMPVYVVACLVAFLDQLTKYWIIGAFHYGERQSVIPGLFELTHVRNPGGAFSFFADGPFFERMLFFVGMTCVAIVLLLVFFRRLEPQARLTSTALGGILGGALGNLLDRLVHGEVIDFLDWIGKIDTNGFPPEPDLRPAGRAVPDPVRRPRLFAHPAFLDQIRSYVGHQCFRKPQCLRNGNPRRPGSGPQMAEN